MAGRRTFYDALGVARDASSVDIASAFRDKLAAMKDKPGVLPEAMDELREAYQTLANPTRRAEYDRSLPPSNAREARARGAAPVAEGAGPDPRTRITVITVAVVLLAIMFWGWKRHRVAGAPQASAPAVVSMTRSEVASTVAEPAARSEAVSRGPLSAEQVFAQASASIVRIHAQDDKGQRVKQGSGVVIGTGRVITNCHVASGASRLTVSSGGTSYSASIRVADEPFDLCSLDVTGLTAPAVSVGSVETVRTGQKVFAIGAPMGLELTISEGIVSSLREAPQGKVIQTTAPVSPGSSGGGLFDPEGRLVGIVTFQAKSGQNLNFAVPADWIAQMSSRSAPSEVADLPGAPPASDSAAPAPEREREATAADMVPGSWHCFGSLTGRNADYDYGEDGVLRITQSDGKVASGRYLVSGRRIAYQGTQGAFAFEIESISPSRMVQLVGGGERLACDRRS
jgi:serine protease Do